MSTDKVANTNADLLQQRAASLTSAEEGVTYSWDNLTVSTKERKPKNYLVRKTKGVPSKVIVDNGKLSSSSL
jgi:hypothetical protein